MRHTLVLNSLALLFPVPSENRTMDFGFDASGVVGWDSGGGMFIMCPSAKACHSWTGQPMRSIESVSSVWVFPYLLQASLARQQNSPVWFGVKSFGLVG